MHTSQPVGRIIALVQSDKSVVCAGELTKCVDVILLADRTNGRAYATVLHLSVVCL